MFDTKEPKLKTLLDQADTGKMQLPDFQRGWIWNDTRIKELIASVAQGFPIGAIMRLDAGGSFNFKRRPIEGSRPSEHPETFLLDGQQRITSLYQALKYGQAVKTRDTRGKRVSRHYYIDMLGALTPGFDVNDVVRSIPKDKKVTSDFGRVVELDLTSDVKEFENHMFPAQLVFEPMDWLFDYQDYWMQPERSHPRGQVSDFRKQFNDQILNSFADYQLPVIDLESDVRREAVCLVFEKVNTGGVPLDVFELLTAMLAAEDFDLRIDWEARSQRLTEAGAVLANLERDLFLRAVSLLVTMGRREAMKSQTSSETPSLPPVGCRRSDILTIKRAEYEDWAPVAENGFEEAAKFLRRLSIFSRKDLPYATQIVPLAVIMAKLGDRLHAANAIEALRKWYWSGVFGEAYGGTVDTQIARDVQQVPDFVLGGVPPQVVVEANLEPDRLLSLRTRNSAAYKGVHALLMNVPVRDWLTDQEISQSVYDDEQIDIHHVFPKHWCENDAVKQFGIPIPKRIFDSAINKSPLSRKTNQKIGRKAPSRYVGELNLSNPHVEQAIVDHVIDIHDLHTDDFSSFFVNRGKSLMRLISAAMGKELSDGDEVFRKALESANLQIEFDDYDDESQDEILLQAAG